MLCSTCTASTVSIPRDKPRPGSLRLTLGLVLTQDSLTVLGLYQDPLTVFGLNFDPLTVFGLNCDPLTGFGLN